eukprot:m.114238 g.114238  ORF g.114238 m.114238 type:complete len:706 (-) comp15470_c0_seq2:76-2193(-)
MSESPSKTMERLMNQTADSKPSSRVYGSKSKPPSQRPASNDFSSIAAQPRKSNTTKTYGWNAKRSSSSNGSVSALDTKRAKTPTSVSEESTTAVSAILIKRTSSSTTSLKRSSSTNSQQGRRLQRTNSSTASIRSTSSRPDSSTRDTQVDTMEEDTQPLDHDDHPATTTKSQSSSYGSPPTIKRTQSSQGKVPASPSLRKHRTAPANLKRRVSSADSFIDVSGVADAHDQRELGANKQLNDDVEYILSGVKNAKKPSEKLLILCQVIGRVRESTFRRHLRTYGQIAALISMCSTKPEDTEALKLASVLLLYHLASDSLSGRAAYLATTLLSTLLKSNADLVLRQPAASTSAAMSLLSSKSKSKTKSTQPTRSEYRLVLPLMKTVAKELHVDVPKLNLKQLVLATTCTMLANEAASDDVSDAVRTFDLLAAIGDTLMELGSNSSNIAPQLLDQSSALVCKQMVEGLQQAVHDNSDNLTFVTEHQDGQLLETVANLVYGGFQCFERGQVMLPMAQAAVHHALKLLLACTHNQDLVCQRLGRMEWPRLACIVVLGSDQANLPSEQRIDLSIMTLSLLANLMEHSLGNRGTFASYTMADGKTTMEAACQLFQKHQEETMEMDSIETQQEQDTTDNVLSAYLAIFVACLCSDAPRNQSALASITSNEQRADMARILQEFVMLQETAGAGNGGDMRAITRLILTLQDCARL